MKDSIIEDQEEFMLRGKQTVAHFNQEQKDCYEDMIYEEYGEFVTSNFKEPVENQIKECVDIIVVCLGWLFSVGVNPFEAWKLVFENNLAKVTGKIIKDNTGKIMKSPESIVRKEQMMKNIKKLMDD